MYNIGKIVNTHGIRGLIKIKPDTDFPSERFAKGKIIYVPSTNENFEISQSSKNKDVFIVGFVGIDNINQIIHLKGKDIFEKESPEKFLKKDEFLLSDIIGITMKDWQTGETIGEVTDVLQPGANDVWEVKLENGQTVYVPFLKNVMKNIDIGNGEVSVDMPGGIIDEN